MIAWLVLLLSVAAGGVLLTRPGRLGVAGAFRGSTLLGYLLLSVGMTSPLILELDRMMLHSGAGPDAFIGLWNLWWTRTALEAGSNPLFTDWIFHPAGTSLALHTYSLTYGVLTLPLQWLFARSGPPGLFAVYNLVLLASFTLTGYFGYRLALRESRHRGAALLAGIILAFANFRFANTVRLHVIATEWLVLFVWASAALLEEPSPRRLIGWMGAGILLVYASLEYTAYAVLVLALLAAAERIRRSRSHPSQERTTRKPRASLRSWILHAAGGAVACGILLWPLLSQLARRLAEGGYGFDPRLTEHFSADLVDFLLPNPRHPLWGALTEPVTAACHLGDGGFGLSLGLIASGMFVLSGIAAARRGAGRRWTLGCLLFLVLSLGPVLHVEGIIHRSVPLPQAALSRLLPFLGGSRTPIRYIAPAEIFLAVACAVGWAEWRRRRSAMTAGGLVPEVVLGGLILFESLAAPFPMTRVAIPEAYRFVARQARGSPPSALLNLPVLPARENLLYQTVHHRKLVEDVESAVPLRSPNPRDPFAQPIWGLVTRGLAQPGAIEGIPAAERGRAVETIRDFLRANDIRWIVVRNVPATGFPRSDPHSPTPPTPQEPYRAYCENLRFLHPVLEQEVGDHTVFELELPESPGR
jgi:hypothetical protein